MQDYDVECEQCGESYNAPGSWSGDGWNEPRVFEACSSDSGLCLRCREGSTYRLEFRVVGWEDFSDMSKPEAWADWFEGFKDVYLKEVKIECID
tara:strand:+ start:1404 stop:1685 length:282 start_codon:yes stop_codon:yes gene_type:complete